MTTLRDPAVSVVMDRLDRCYSGQDCDWDRFYQPRWERANFATRYHLVYPGLAYYVLLKQKPELGASIRPKLDTMYRGLLAPRTWQYWHAELGETTWPLQERNLTYAGRLATFVGFYIDAFGAPPADRIELDNRSASYGELSRNLWQQALASPSGGVSCYHHQSMVMCNAHLLINNILHDRLFGSSYALGNDGWLKTLEDHLVRPEGLGSLFYYGTQSDSCSPAEKKASIGMDIWSLFLMSGVVPDRVRDWFARWRENITQTNRQAYVEITTGDEEAELSSTLLATAWAFCLAKELGEMDLAKSLRATLNGEVVPGFTLDPLLSGLYLLGEVLEPGAFHQLVVGKRQGISTRLP